jgi:cysteinyl-tRNA synthetase
MPPRLHDTLSDRVIPLEPREPGHVRMYVCGPTVYDHPHLGHMRMYVVFDVLVRHLRAQGLRVTYVRNITDIDDKILRRAAELSEEPSAIAERFTLAYAEAARRLFCLQPDLEPRVTEHVPEIIALIERLVIQRAAYAADGDVYYDVQSFPEYGKLSHRKLADMESGASGRVQDEEARRKRHPADFALWKGAKPNEPAWPSPWGPGRPGWHIECSAMCMRHLGDACDVHGGGLDLVFPHHENEIAQSEQVTGRPLARLWMHNGFLEVNKQKMSKSLGNFFSTVECFRVVEPEALRYFFLTTHYRAPLGLDWNEDGSGKVTGFPQIEECERRVEYLYTTRLRLLGLEEQRIDAKETRVEPELLGLAARLRDALDDDLNLPLSLAAVAEFAKRVNDAVDVASRKSGRLGKAARDHMLRGFDSIGLLLGLCLDDGPAFLGRVRARRLERLELRESDVEAKIQARIAARNNREFARADALRDELLALGIELMDGPGGTTWRVA